MYNIFIFFVGTNRNLIQILYTLKIMNLKAYCNDNLCEIFWIGFWLYAHILQKEYHNVVILCYMYSIKLQIIFSRRKTILIFRFYLLCHEFFPFLQQHTNTVGCFLKMCCKKASTYRILRKFPNEPETTLTQLSGWQKNYSMFKVYRWYKIFLQNNKWILNKLDRSNITFFLS